LPEREIPCPLRLMVSGLPVAPVNVTVMVAVRGLPTSSGAKTTAILQVFPLESVEPQVLACPKSPECAPPRAIPVIVIVEPEVFESTDVCGESELTLPTVVVAKLMLVTESVTQHSALPVPARGDITVAPAGSFI